MEKKGVKICALMFPFYETTNLIYGTSYATSNLYLLQVWKIQCVLMDPFTVGSERKIYCY